ncbi:MAG: hypothetical protein EOO04_29255, partial [Chitinophagaceae bacterium]
MKLTITLLGLLLLSLNIDAQVKLDVEGGVVFGTNYNDVRVPGTTGSQFDANEALKVKPKVFYR